MGHCMSHSRISPSLHNVTKFHNLLNNAARTSLPPINEDLIPTPIAPPRRRNKRRKKKTISGGEVIRNVTLSSVQRQQLHDHQEQLCETLEENREDEKDGKSAENEQRDHLEDEQREETTNEQRDDLTDERRELFENLESALLDSGVMTLNGGVRLNINKTNLSRTETFSKQQRTYDVIYENSLEDCGDEFTDEDDDNNNEDDDIFDEDEFLLLHTNLQQDFGGSIYFSIMDR